MKKLLCKKELDVIDSLVKAWNAYIQLEVLHPDANKEFQDAIHKANLIVMARPVQRQFNLE